MLSSLIGVYSGVDLLGRVIFLPHLLRSFVTVSQSTCIVFALPALMSKSSDSLFGSLQ